MSVCIHFLVEIVLMLSHKTLAFMFYNVFGSLSLSLSFSLSLTHTHKEKNICCVNFTCSQTWIIKGDLQLLSQQKKHDLNISLLSGGSDEERHAWCILSCSMFLLWLKGRVWIHESGRKIGSGSRKYGSVVGNWNLWK